LSTVSSVSPPRLSLTVGVPSNLLGFYVMGLIGNRKMSEKTIRKGTLISIMISLSPTLLYPLHRNYLGETASLLFVLVSIICGALNILSPIILPKYRKISMSSSIGLGIGSAWIGLGIWVFSKFPILPSNETNLSFAAAIGWFIWTYLTEIPFLLLLVPPIIKIVSNAFNI